MTDKLLDCPFCGGEASSKGRVSYSPYYDAGRWGDGTKVTEACFCCCIRCQSRCGGISSYQTEAEAITAWNTRAALTDHQPAPISATLQKLANLEATYSATAEAAATHLNAAMDAQDKLAIALSALDAIYSEATREGSRDHHLRRCAIVQAGQVLGK